MKFKIFFIMKEKLNCLSPTKEYLFNKAHNLLNFSV